MNRVDALARLQLEARRRGVALLLYDVTDDLRELIELAGLTQALGVQPRGQAEGAELLGVEEVVQRLDPPA